MKAHSKFYSSLGLLLLLNVIIKPVWIFFIDRQVQNTVGTATYGTYFSLFNFSVVLSFLLDWGLTNYFNRSLAANQEMISRTGDFLFTRLLFSILYVIIVCSVAWLSGISEWTILWQVMGIQVLTSLFLFLRSIITAQQWFRTDAWLSVLDKIAMILICGSFLYIPAVFGEISIGKFLWVQVICTAFAAACAGFILLRNGVKLSRISKGIIDGQTIRAALPFAIIVLLMSVHYRLDAFLLERLHVNGAYEAGLYAGAYRLLDAANMIGYLYASFLLPYIARRLNNPKDIAEKVLEGRHVLILFSLGTALVSIFLAPWIQQLLYHNTEEAAISIIRFCLPVLLAYSLTQVYGTALTAMGHIGSFCYIVAGSVLANLVLNFLLIPAWGARGCCVAALVSQGICGISTVLAAHKKGGINIHYRSLLMYIFIGVLLGGFLYLSVRLLVNPWLVITGVVIITVTTALLTKLFDIGQWKKILKKTN